MDTTTALFAAILLPTFAMVANMVLARASDFRDAVTFAAALATFACVVQVLANEGSATTPAVELVEVFAGVSIAFNVEPLGLMFALIASGLWVLTHPRLRGAARVRAFVAHARGLIERDRDLIEGRRPRAR